MTVLDVAGLSVRLGGNDVVNDVSFSVAPGRRLGILGESGSGKTVTALSIVDMLPDGAETRGEISFENRQLNSMSSHERRRLRGGSIAMVFQDAVAALNPVIRIGDQIADVYRRHTGATKRAAHTRAVELLGEMGIPVPAERARDYPHHFSGGMAQRALLALALAGSPRLLIADEPTSGLDTTVQAAVVDLIRGLFQGSQRALVIITHDVSVVERLCTDVVVMYAGMVMEAGPAREVLHQPANPYTQRLLGSVELGASGKPAYIPGYAPQPWALPQGCPFADRCHLVEDRCRVERPALDFDDQGHGVACHVVRL